MVIYLFILFCTFSVLSAHIIFSALMTPIAGYPPFCSIQKNTSSFLSRVIKYLELNCWGQRFTKMCLGSFPTSQASTKASNSMLIWRSIWACSLRTKFVARFSLHQHLEMLILTHSTDDKSLQSKERAPSPLGCIARWQLAQSERSVGRLPFHSLPAPCSQHHWSCEPFQNTHTHTHYYPHWGNAPVSFLSALQNSIRATGIVSWEFSPKPFTILMHFLPILWTNESKKTKPKADGCCLTVEQQKARNKSSTNSFQHEIIFSKTSLECDNALRIPTKAQHKNTNSLYVHHDSADDLEPGKSLQPDGCRGPRESSERRWVCVKWTRGLSRSPLQTQCCTLQYEQSHPLLTFNLLAPQDQNNKAVSHTWNGASSIPYYDIKSEEEMESLG